MCPHGAASLAVAPAGKDIIRVNRWKSGRSSAPPDLGTRCKSRMSRLRRLWCSRASPIAFIWTRLYRSACTSRVPSNSCKRKQSSPSRIRSAKELKLLKNEAGEVTFSPTDLPHYMSSPLAPRMNRCGLECRGGSSPQLPPRIKSPFRTPKSLTKKTGGQGYGDRPHRRR